MTAASSPIEPGTVLAGKLRVVRVLGAGGMGSVYEVEHQITKHRRALKLMHRGIALLVPDAVTRFLREASAAGRIGNPHIVETFDAGELPSGEPYIVMEMLHGHSLADLIEKNGPMDLPVAVELLCQACAGVQAAHDAGIVHRDLKPDNLFVVEGAVPLVKVLDFGISKFDPERTGDARMTAEGATMGTPSYMAPEQIGGDGAVLALCVIYALGVVFYECLTGQVPYLANSLPELALRIHEGHYTPIRELQPNLPASIDAILARTLVRDRATRYATARELAAALDQLVPAGARSGVRAVSQPMAAASQRPNAATPGTEPTLVADSRALPRKRSTLIVVLAALALAAAGVVALLSGREHAAPSIVRPATTPVATQDHDAGRLIQKPSPVAELPAAPSTAPTTALEKPAVTQPVNKPAPIQPVSPLDPKQKNRARGPNTRAHEHGLLEDNPF